MWRFSKPVNSEPTRCLYVTGWPAEQFEYLQVLFAAYGPSAPPPATARTSDQLGVPGLQLLHDFVSPGEEIELLNAVAHGPWQHLAKRRVQHFGWEFDYSTRSFARPLAPLPSWAAAVATRVSALPCVSQPLDQLTVNEYAPGVGLSPHVDTHSAFTGAIVSLSLGSDCVMELRKCQDHRPLLLPRRSLLVLGGEARYAWQHYIPHRKVDPLGLPPTSPFPAPSFPSPAQPHTTNSTSSTSSLQAPLRSSPAAPSAPAPASSCQAPQQQQDVMVLDNSSSSTGQRQGQLAHPTWELAGGGGPEAYAAPLQSLLHPRLAQPGSLQQDPGVAETGGAAAPQGQQSTGQAASDGSRPAVPSAQPDQPEAAMMGDGPEQLSGGAAVSAGVGGGLGRQQLVRGTRVSLTFRQVRGFPCTCAWPDACDSQAGGAPPTRLATLGLAGGPLPGLPRDSSGACSHAALPALSVADARTETVSAGVAADEVPMSKIGTAEGIEPRTLGTVEKAPEAGEVANPPAALRTAVTSKTAAGTGSGQQLQALEDRHVNAVYDAIASHFSATRFAIWPRVREFLDRLPPGALVADVGCGNGKYFGVRRDIMVLGSDRSAGLAEVASRRLHPAGLGPGQVGQMQASSAAQLHVIALRADVLQADGLALPYRPASCDGVLCIAVLHHISSRARRLRLLQQLVRLLRPGGLALVTVWALEQEEPQKTVAKWTRISAPVVDGVEPDTGMALLEGGAAASSVPRGDDVSFDVTSHTAEKAGVEPPPSQTGTGSEGGDKGADFMVPWHLPFHRAGVAATRQDAGRLAANEGSQAAVQVLPRTLPGQQADAAMAGGDENKPTGAMAVINAAKGSVVYQRYYHLFEEGELPQLAQALPGCSVVQTFYDKSNWRPDASEVPDAIATSDDRRAAEQQAHQSFFAPICLRPPSCTLHTSLLPCNSGDGDNILAPLEAKVLALCWAHGAGGNTQQGG
ncbi:hypothetical protein QJQ45_016460 [Haematococcus lacustris]|nr:hypothetical protein QJQ45_016460 [Haematococcus lacustris]